MEDRNSPGMAEKREIFVQRVLRRLALILLTRFLSFAGWGAVVGLPAMILGPRRFAGAAKKYPIASGTICIAGLIGVALWSEDSHSRPTEFEIESIDHFDEPIELLAQTKPPYVSDQSDTEGLVDDGILVPDRQSDAVEVRRSEGERHNESRPVDADVFGVAAAESGVERRVVWLTGDIEEFSAGKPANPVRSAVRFSPKRR